MDVPPPESMLSKLEMLHVSSEPVVVNDLEREQIKKQYLGQKEVKAKVIRPSEKFKNIFTFDWSLDEDTLKSKFGATSSLMFSYV
jgi:ATP-dependent RNA helicase DDX23/PRP28